ncbi:hypothetical protein GCM10022224_069950 [Nonomuraea antimicrobica]|uniref:Copper(I)-binding protein n=1 Tax=Nonomuraea antimicrobica TaxID=561173 RepID=A0ABP7CTK4_9ACTN
MRPIVSAAIAVVLVTCGCATVEFSKENRAPKNDGANADVGGTLYLRNAFLLSNTDPASPSTQMSLFAVLINDGPRTDQVERISVPGGGTVRLIEPLTLPPNQPVGTGSKPIGTLSGVSGTSVPMTFTFRNTKPVRVSVPIKLRIGWFASLTPAPAAPPQP